MKNSKILVAYFSVSGRTEKLAHTIAVVAQADLFEIKPKQAYTAADLEWHNQNSRCAREINEPMCRPAIADRVENMEQYSVVFIGFPIWHYEAPRIIATFVESYDFSGKTLTLFATSNGSGLGKSESVLKRLCVPNATWKTGMRLGSETSICLVQKWLRAIELV